MKPLDLTKPVQTRDGKKVRILCTDAAGKESVVGVIRWNGIDMARQWSPDGCYLSSKSKNDNDLINAPEPLPIRRGWVNIYPHSVVDYNYSCVYHNKHTADSLAQAHRIACVEVEIKGNVGDGL